MSQCLCGHETATTGALCPIHMVWPYIRGRVPAGYPIFPGVAANNFNRALKATMTALGFDQGGIYSPHGFRRGRQIQ